MNSQERIIEKATNLSSNISPDGGTLKYDFMTSLQNIAKAKIMTTLWMNQMIRQTEKDSEIDLVPSVSQLPLPDSIIKELTLLIPHLRCSVTRWIVYYDRFLLNTKQNTEIHAKDFVNNITWTARGKIDHVQTAKSILINQNSYLTDEQKYNIACNFCLEEEITALGAKILNPYYLNSVDRKNYPMVYFWTMHITRDNSLSDHYRSLSHQYSSINEHVMLLLIYLCKRGKDCLEVPIRYVWNKLSEEEKAKKVVEIFLGQAGNFTYSLLSDLNYEQQQEVFKRCSRNILQNIINDWSWENYFLSTALHVLNIIDPNDFHGILCMIISKAEENVSINCNLVREKYKNIFKQLYKESSKTLRDSVIERLDYFLVNSLSWELDLDIIDLIFEDLDSSQKKNIILGSHGIRYCTRLIRKNQWNLLELFIKYTLTSKEDINSLKQRLQGDRGIQIAVYLLEKNALDELDYFMNWAFNSAGDINQFRRNLAHANYAAILKSIIKENELDFTDLENHFKWCAKDEPQAINQFKAEAPRYLISNLLESSQFVFADQLLNWCLENQAQIARFKSNMYKDNNLSPAIISLIYSLLGKQSPFILLDSFVVWSFTSEQEIQEFKMWLLYPQEEKYSVCADLLRNYRFDLADKFINWCGISHEAVGEFKNMLMLSFDDMIYILYSRTCTGFVERYSGSKMQQLIKWFNPSAETVQKCKTLLVGNTAVPRNMLSILLNALKQFKS